MSTPALFNPDDQQLLAKTQDTRLKIIDHFMGEDGRMPKHQGEWAALHQALDGIDRNVYTKAKLKLNEENTQQRQQMFDMITEVLRQTNQQHADTPIAHEPPKVEVKLELNAVPGEMDIGVYELTYDAFMRDADAI
ncbi:MAG: hypothetical protein ACR2HF_16270 [Methylococcaceae bacterium]